MPAARVAVPQKRGTSAAITITPPLAVQTRADGCSRACSRLLQKAFCYQGKPLHAGDRDDVPPADMASTSSLRYTQRAGVRSSGPGSISLSSRSSHSLSPMTWIETLCQLWRRDAPSLEAGKPPGEGSQGRRSDAAVCTRRGSPMTTDVYCTS